MNGSPPASTDHLNLSTHKRLPVEVHHPSTIRKYPSRRRVLCHFTFRTNASDTVENEQIIM